MYLFYYKHTEKNENKKRQGQNSLPELFIVVVL